VGASDEQIGSNGHAPPEEVKVRFGRGETDTMPLVWAEKILTELRATRPAQFGKLLSAAVLGNDK
jgi:hypothetical protein